jgi:hypothetical protein
VDATNWAVIAIGQPPSPTVQSGCPDPGDGDPDFTESFAEYLMDLKKIYDNIWNGKILVK